MRSVTASASTIALLLGLVAAAPAAQAATAPTALSTHSVSSAGGTTVVIGTDGRPYGTGINDHGQLTGGTAPVTTLTPLSGLPSGITAAAVVSDGSNVAVLGSNGKAYAAGSNSSHQIRSGSTSDVMTLTEIEWLVGASIKDLEAEDQSIAAVLQDGSIKVGGLNRSARFTNVNTTSPVVLPALPSGELAAEISVAFQGSAVRTATGKIYTSGNNTFGELGSTLGQQLTWTLDPMPVAADSVDVDDDHLVALGSDGQAYAAGKQTDGDIGSGSDHGNLVAISNPATGVDLVTVTTGATHTVAIGGDGRLYGIGNNDYGQLTDHPSGPFASQTFAWTPLASGVARDIIGISAGTRDTIFVDDDGILRGSGDNTSGVAGQITNGTANTSEGQSISMVLLSGQVIANTSRPTISGTAQYGQTLTATTGSWSPAVRDLSYQWKRDGVDVPGANLATYLLTAPDIGSHITVAVTARRGRFADASAVSDATGPVALAPKPVYTSSHLPTLTGTLTSGHTLKISRTSAQLMAAFSPDVTSLAYTWYRGSTPIGGAHSSTYKLKSADKGKKVRVRIYGLLTNHTTGSILTATVTIKM
jgi:alpha-tubulin suppressor-like RCC1 family protein